MNHYGTVEKAQAYFDQRLHEFAWTAASAVDRVKALIAASTLIDNLNFMGDKSDPDQPREFPRDGEEEVPEDICRATYEIAHSLLDQKDPEMELESLSLTSTSYAGVRSSFDRQFLLEHLVNMIPSALAWRLLRPYLRDNHAVTISRVS